MTKKVTASMLIFGSFCGCIPFILSYLQRDPVIELGVTWVTAVVAVCLGYFVRGFKDSKAEAEERRQYNESNTDDP